MPGFSAECVSGHHKACTEDDCRCLCHPAVQKLLSTPKAHSPGEPSWACPICARVPRPGDLFCREDGERLVHPHKCECGAIGDNADRFCGKCGKKLKQDSPEPSEEEIKKLEAWARTRPSDVEVPPTEVH